jgi:hypothetical protein
MMHRLCNKLLACALRAWGIDIRQFNLSERRPLANGGFILVLDPRTSEDA